VFHLGIGHTELDLQNRTENKTIISDKYLRVALLPDKKLFAHIFLATE